MRFAELLGRSRLLLAAAVLLQWLTTLVVALRSEEVGFGAIELLHVAVLGPIALLCAYRIGARLGGVALGAWTLVVWVTTPWLLHVFTLASYDATVRDRVLPLGLGLTTEPGYAAGVALLASVALLGAPGLRGAAAAGVAAGVAIVLVPEALVFLVAVAVALLAAWQPRELGAFLVAAAPAVLAIAIWRQPAFGDLALDTLQGNLAGLREYFWSQRLLQWLPLAGDDRGRPAVGTARAPARRLARRVDRGRRGARGHGLRERRARARAPARTPRLPVAGSGSPTARADARRPPRPARAPGGVLVRFLALRAHALLEQRHALGEDRVLVGEPRDHRGVVQQHDEDEERGHGEEHGRWVAGDADPARDRVQAAAPGREHEQHDAGREPEQRVALAQAPAADQLEHDEDEQDRRDRRGDGDAERGHASSSGTTRRLKRPMNRASSTLTT